MSLNWKCFRACGLFVLSPIVISSPSLSKETEIFGPLPDDFVVYAVGSYSGTTAIDAQIDKSGHEAGQSEVVVNVPAHPVSLDQTSPLRLWGLK